MTAPISEINQASKTYDAGPPAVDQLSLTGRAAEARAVLGPSASGKSTLLIVTAGPCRLAPPCLAGQRTESRGF